MTAIPWNEGSALMVGSALIFPAMLVSVVGQLEYFARIKEGLYVQ